MGDFESDLDTTIEIINEGELIIYFQFLIFAFFLQDEESNEIDSGTVASSCQVDFKQPFPPHQKSSLK